MELEEREVEAPERLGAEARYRVRVVSGVREGTLHCADTRESW